MGLQIKRKGDVSRSARYTVGLMGEFGTSFAGGAGRDIRRELPSGAGIVANAALPPPYGFPGEPRIKPGGSKLLSLPVLAILAVILLAS
jgi:hypothetical protein